jgi:hypothetical protein
MLVTSYFKILENQLAYRHQQACNWLTVISRPAGLPSPAGLQVYRHQQACKMEKIIT